MKAIAVRSVLAIVLLSSAVVAMWQLGLVRKDYWEQLDPWVGFLGGGLATLAGTLTFQFWRFGERSQYYLRLGRRLPFGDETALGPSHGTTLLVGRAAHVDVLEFPPMAQRAVWIATVLAIAFITVDNRAIAMLRDLRRPSTTSQPGYCKPPEPPKPVETVRPGCRLVRRAYELGYAKSLGNCAPGAEGAKATQEVPKVCQLRQLDEPYLHYAWRLLDKARTKLTSDDGTPGMPGMRAGVEAELDTLGPMFHSRLSSVAMEPRSSHHLFTNLPAPRASLGERLRAIVERGCGARLARLRHFPAMEDSPAGPSKLLEHVIAQLLFNPIYRPVVAQCEEITIHWDAPHNACTLLADNPSSFLDDHRALEPILGVLSWRRNKAELARLEAQPREVAPPQRVISLQCLIFDDQAVPGSVSERDAIVDGERLRVREARIKPLTADEASQLRLYKHLAELLTEGFGYGRLTSTQAIGDTPDQPMMTASFREPGLMLTKLDLLRDADLFLGNEWLTTRADLLEVYPYHVHLKNFIEIFRRQYKLKRGRL
jgi:hypothetical protein